MRRFSSAELFAILVSVASVAIAVLGNRTQERLLAASVWPNLSFISGNASDDGQRQIIALGIENSGNGPARIRRFTLEYDHKPIASASELLERCCGFHPARILTSTVVGKVLRAGEQITFLQLPNTPEIAEGWRKFDRVRFDLVLSACFCSTLNECWNARSDREDPEPVGACDSMPGDQRWHG